MGIIDSREEIKKIDLHNVLGSVEALPDQIVDAWGKASLIRFPESYKTIKHVVVSGMGGSALGSHVIKNLYKDNLRIPFEVYSHYQLPAYVNEDTLVLLSSYSGSTEETLAVADQAKKQGAKIITITSGGKLLEMAQVNNWPVYKIEPQFNPSNQPRMGVGYAIIGQLAMFSQLGLCQVEDQEISNLVSNLRLLSSKLQPEVTDNPAKYLAYQAFRKAIVLIAAEHLIGAAHVLNNQLNENSKTLTAEWHLPEFNHHYMEALSHPPQLKDDVLFLLFNSKLYHERVSLRFPLTKQVIDNSSYQAELIQTTASSKLEQVFEIITLGAFFNFYLSMLYKIDPAPIPAVDWFKSQISN